MLKTVNQHEDQRAIYGRKGSYFEAEKIRKINQSHWTSIRQPQQFVLKKRETTGVLSNRHRTGRTRETLVDDRKIVRAVKKTPKTCDIKNDLQRIKRINIEAIPQDANQSSAVRIGRPDWNLQRSK